MYSIGPIFCRAVGSQTFNVYLDKVGVSSKIKEDIALATREITVLPGEIRPSGIRDENVNRSISSIVN